MAAIQMVGFSSMPTNHFVLQLDHYSGGSTSRTGAGGSSFSDNRRQYEEYDAGDDEITHTPTRSNSVRNPTRKSSAPAPPASQPQPEVDLLGGFDDSSITSAPAPAVALARNKALPSVDGTLLCLFICGEAQHSILDDDFADFQAAPTQVSQAPAFAAPTKKQTLMDMMESKPASPMAFGMNQQRMAASHRPQLSLSSTPQLTPVAAQPPLNLFGNTTGPLRPTPMGLTMSAPIPPANYSTDKRQSTAPAAKGPSNFDDLWSLSLGSTTTTTTASGAGKSIKDLEKEKATAGLWGVGQKAGGTSIAPKPAAFGTFNAAPPSGVDDLLL